MLELGRRERDYVAQILRDKKELVELLGPATDHSERTVPRVRALEAVIEYLQRPYFSINPFL
jgi:hypothetical protein